MWYEETNVFLLTGFYDDYEHNTIYKIYVEIWTNGLRAFKKEDSVEKKPEEKKEELTEEQLQELRKKYTERERRIKWK